MGRRFRRGWRTFFLGHSLQFPEISCFSPSSLGSRASSSPAGRQLLLQAPVHPSPNGFLPPPSLSPDKMSCIEEKKGENSSHLFILATDQTKKKPNTSSCSLSERTERKGGWPKWFHVRDVREVWERRGSTPLTPFALTQTACYGGEKKSVNPLEFTGFLH